MAGRVGLARIEFAASVVQQRTVPAGSGGSLNTDVGHAQTFLAGRSPLRITSDPTQTLPSPIANQAEILDADFDRAAAELNIEATALKAVAAVEGGGRCFAADGRPIIRYELHVFQKKFTSRKYANTHPQFSAEYGPGNLAHSGQQADEFSMLYGAMLMRGQRDNAVASASWGAFQIMGFNHKAAGYATATDFALAMHRSASKQLDAFISFAKSQGAAQYLRTKDWANFALHYNGKDYRDNDYDGKMERAYRRLGGTV